MSLNVQVAVVGPIQSNSYLVYAGSRERAILIDAGGDADRIINMVERERVKVRVIIATHAHFDHVFAVDELRERFGCEFLLHRDDVPVLRTFSDSLFRWVGLLKKEPRPDGYVAEGDLIDLGDLQLSVIHTPGHTPGSISLYGGGAVFTGDTLFFGSVGRTDLFGGDFEALVYSIRYKLYKLPPETNVYPGHGPSTTIGIEKVMNSIVREE
ncbi:MAG: MBL fold metallo-hydrolase [Aigarchaeota archaeon]|nr:MBL fold metallo-hydrolase [Aigarchaeota archaeon]MDW8093142.1 MBL fold metallo-hydrolase [Nitrososphaerota archaeon]